MITKDNAKIIATFPGSGNTYFMNNQAKNGYDIKLMDLSSYPFTYNVTEHGAKLSSARYPKNYVDYIDRARKVRDVILIDSSVEIQKELVDRGIEYCLVLPNISFTAMTYLSRYKNNKYGIRRRYYISELISEWVDVIKEELSFNPKAEKFYLSQDIPYLSDIIDHILLYYK